MTVSTTTSRIEYAGNGTTTDFSFPYRFLADGDLKVYLVNTAGTPVLKSLTTHYTLAGAGESAGGTVTMLTAPAVGESLVIFRDPALTQSVDLTENDRLPVETAVEQPLDRLTMIAQFTRDKVNRSLALADGDITVDMTLPALTTLKGKTLLFDSATGAPTAGPTAAAISSAETYATEAEASATAAAASAVTAAAAAAALPVPADPGDDGKILKADGGVYVLDTGATGGDVEGPASSTARGIPLYSDTTGKLLKAGPALGTSGHPLVSAGAGADPAFGQVPTAGIADAAVTMAKIAQASATTGQALIWSGSAWAPTTLAASSGEVNTASNSGSGSGVYKTKSGVDLVFKSLVWAQAVYTDGVLVNTTGADPGGVTLQRAFTLMSAGTNEITFTSYQYYVTPSEGGGGG